MRCTCSPARVTTRRARSICTSPKPACAALPAPPRACRRNSTRRRASSSPTPNGLVR
ncbi:Uncharacterised protein [Bordetella pertussis]|nr:Uncharacterised protein [Bordetella pertussis]